MRNKVNYVSYHACTFIQLRVLQLITIKSVTRKLGLVT